MSPQQIVNLCDKTSGIEVGKECSRVVEKSDGRISVIFGVVGPNPLDGSFIESIDEALQMAQPQIRHFCSTGHANFWMHHALVMHPDEVEALVRSDEAEPEATGDEEDRDNEAEAAAG
jgi:hypothetical protein